MARKQDIGNSPTAEVCGAGVMRILRVAAERCAERFFDRGVGVTESTRLFAQNRVADDHRRQLAASDHITTDRNRVATKVLHNSLVEAFVTTAKQSHGWLGRQLIDELLVEHAAARRERNHAPLARQLDRIDGVKPAQRSLHHVDAQNHSSTAAEWRVIYLTAAKWRVLAQIERAQLAAVGNCIGYVALLSEPFEPLREKRYDVELHRSSTADECEIYVDSALIDVDRANRITHHRNQQLGAIEALDLKNLAGRQHQKL